MDKKNTFTLAEIAVIKCDEDVMDYTEYKKRQNIVTKLINGIVKTVTKIAKSIGDFFSKIVIPFIQNFNKIMNEKEDEKLKLNKAEKWLALEICKTYKRNIRKKE